MTRFSRTAIAAGAAAFATAGVLATSGSAQSPQGTTLHLVTKSQKHVGFFPKGAPKQGSRFGFGDKVSGDDSGIDRGVCTFMGGRAALCTVQVQLANGSLSVQGMVPQRANKTPLAIIGGTGAYNGARGTAVVTDTSSSSATVDVSLLP
jgi:dirigent-like protein